MYKRNIALAAAMLLAGSTAMAQSAPPQKDARPHRPANTANDRRGEDAAAPSTKKQG